MYACAPLWSRSLSNAALQSTSCILTQSLRHKWEHQNLSAVLHTVPGENQREVWGGRTNLFSVSPSASSPQSSAGFPSSLRKMQGQNVTWLNISHSLTVLFHLIGITRDGCVSGLAQTIWPHRILPSLSNFVPHFNKIRENGGMSGWKKLVRKGWEETLVCSEELSCCSQERKISQISRWMRMKEQEEQNSYRAIDAAT